MRTMMVTLALVFAAGPASFAADSPYMGTWKLNEAKSKIGSGAPKNTTVIYDAAGDNVKVTVDGVDGKGQPTHNVWTGKFDGKEYPLSGSPTADMRSYKVVNDRTMTFSETKGGNVTTSGRLVVSADGKTRTVTTTATDPQGKKVNGTAVYDKQ